MADYEVDFIAVGENSKSGDAIAFRFGNLNGPRNEQFVGVIDGGTKESGEQLVELIQKRYNTETVDVVISTHPDGDHASGLVVVLEELTVKCLWMHQPWDHSSEIHDLFDDGRITEDSLDRRLRESLDHAHSVEKIAKEKGIPIQEPFSGEAAYRNYLRVLGPSRDFYEELLPYFRDCPDLRVEASSVFTTLSRFAATVAEAVKTAFESWTRETLSDPGTEATEKAENNSSVILLLEVDGKRILFTADAGVPALTRAADYADAIGIDLRSVSKIQIPHHGSQHNVGPTILNRLIGPKLPSPPMPGVIFKSGCASVAIQGAPKHPAKKVLNAFLRRGVKWMVTRGACLRWSSKGAPLRTDYSPVAEPEIFSQVEE